jgi:preprotein translocase subunit SecE
MAAAKAGFLAKTGKYLREVRSEMRKVTWPTKSDLSKYTAVVIVTVLIVSGIIWLADTILYKLVSLILR